MVILGHSLNNNSMQICRVTSNGLIWEDLKSFINTLHTYSRFIYISDAALLVTSIQKLIGFNEFFR
jgi:hypothetical protein